MDRATTQTQMYIVKLFVQQGLPADPTHQHGGLLRALHADARLTLLRGSQVKLRKVHRGLSVLRMLGNPSLDFKTL